MIEKVADTATIVLIGSFNPAIFQPAWFQKQGLLPETETSSASIDTISNDISIFTMSWVRIEVLSERFVARTSDESKFSPLRDLVIGAFRLLEYTPVRQIGLNRDIHYSLPTEDAWHRVGHTLAPKSHWNALVKTPGMKSLMIEAHRDDDRVGLFNIGVKPVLNRTQPMKSWLVEVSFNDHIELGADKTGLDVCTVLEEDWERSMSRAEQIASALITDTSKK